MLRAAFSRLRRVCSIEGFLARRRAKPGWYVEGERLVLDPPPETAALPAGLPPGAACLWGLIRCYCALCLRDATPSFKSRIADPDAPRSFWL
jgi:hypothetical protein